MGWSHSGGCGCGETPASTALISRTESAYIFGNIPTIEIEQNIGWLDSIRADCEFKISQLESLKRDRERTKKWRHDLNALAREFYDYDSLHLDLETRVQIVQQRLGCELWRAEQIAARVHQWAKRQQRSNRNSQIQREHKNGASVTALARMHGLSRQQIYNIVKNDEKMNYLR